MEWQPIETAPRDGTQIVIFGPDVQGPGAPGCSTAEYYLRQDGSAFWEIFHDEKGRYTIMGVATHWVPLPPFPVKP